MFQNFSQSILTSSYRKMYNLPPWTRCIALDHSSPHHRVPQCEPRQPPRITTAGGTEQTTSQRASSSTSTITGKTRREQHTLLDNFLNTVSIFKLLKGASLLPLPNGEKYNLEQGMLATMTA